MKFKLITSLLLLQMAVFALGPSLCRALMSAELRESPNTCCDKNTPSEGSRPDSPEKGKSCPLHELGTLQILATSGKLAPSELTSAATPILLPAHPDPRFLLTENTQRDMDHSTHLQRASIPFMLLYSVFRI